MSAPASHLLTHLKGKRNKAAEHALQQNVPVPKHIPVVFTNPSSAGNGTENKLAILRGANPPIRSGICIAIDTSDDKATVRTALGKG